MSELHRDSVTQGEAHSLVIEALLGRLRADFDEFREKDEAAKAALLLRVGNLESMLSRYEGKLGGIVLLASLVFAGLFAFKEEIMKGFGR